MMKLYDVYKLNNLQVSNQLDLFFALQYYHSFKSIVMNELIDIAEKQSIAIINDSLTSTVCSI
jgi:hypothetical protein